MLAAALLAATGAAAEEMPVPRLLKDAQGQKARWQMEVLESNGRAGKGMTVTVCTDLVQEARKRQGDSGCKHRLVKDTAEEAVVESQCSERKGTISMKRDGKSMLMDIQASGPKGPRSAKIRYTDLGPCRQGN